eukprot:2106624-Amphidinium_carterae.1
MEKRQTIDGQSVSKWIVCSQNCAIPNCTPPPPKRDHPKSEVSKKPMIHHQAPPPEQEDEETRCERYKTMRGSVLQYACCIHGPGTSFEGSRGKSVGAQYCK